MMTAGMMYGQPVGMPYGFPVPGMGQPPAFMPMSYPADAFRQVMCTVHAYFVIACQHKIVYMQGAQ